MTYTAKFNASWAKSKKTPAKKQLEVSATQAAWDEVSEAKAKNNSEMDDALAMSTPASIVPSPVLEQSVPQDYRTQPDFSEPVKNTEITMGQEQQATSDATASLAAAGVRTIDFALLPQSKSDENWSNQLGLRQAASSESEAYWAEASTTDTMWQAEAFPLPPQLLHEMEQHASHFAPLRYQPIFNPSRPNRIQHVYPDSRRGATTDVETNAIQSLANENSVPFILTHRSGRQNSKSHRTRQTLRPSDRPNAYLRDDFDLADVGLQKSLDQGTARLLKEKFTAAEFLEYCRADESAKANVARATRSSNTSIGDTPPKYHRMSRGSSYSRSEANSRANSSNIR